MNPADGFRCNCLITDPPYSRTTHEGQRTGSSGDEPTINYQPLTVRDVVTFVRAWDKAVDEWWVIFGDDTTAMWWKRALRWAGKQTFPLVPWVKPDAAPRKTGEGPQSSTEYIVVARERRMPRVMGSRPGYYTTPTSSTRSTALEPTIPGEKPLWLMRAIVRDYSVRGDTIGEPHAGRATTMVACEEEGRNSVGTERAPETYAMARRRLETPRTIDFVSTPELLTVQPRLIDVPREKRRA